MDESARVERCRNAAAFLGVAREWLLAAEAENNLILANAEVIAATHDHPFREPLYFAVLWDESRIAGCGVCAPPDGLELTALPPGAARLFVPSVAELHPRLAAVGGPPDAALEFARAWARERGGEWQMRHHWHWFRLDAVTRPRRAPPGRLRVAVVDDWPTLAAWAPRYGPEENTPVDVTGLFARLLARGALYVWDDGGAKCVVGVSGRTRHGARIAAVYTPPEFRARGYASNAVAATCEAVLESGVRFCVLAANREPSTQARIYRSVGFRPIREHFAIDLGL